VSKSDKTLVNDATTILKKKLTESFGDGMPDVVKVIEDDIRKVDRLIELLEQFRNDLFYIGIKNLHRGQECVPNHEGNGDDYHIAFWDFEDRFRKRSYRLKYDFTDSRYSAWGVQMHETIPVPTGGVPVTEEMLADLRSKLKPEQVEKITLMQKKWDARKTSAGGATETPIRIVQRS
jgi:hypothetical protein